MYKSILKLSVNNNPVTVSGLWTRFKCITKKHFVSVVQDEKNMTEIRKTASSSDKCFVCGNTDQEAALFPVRVRGEDKWVCAKCLPRLIHG